jgi:hypothetical protein
MKSIFAVLSVAALGSIFFAAPSASAINPCSNVDITVDNEHPSGNPVKILCLKYEVNGAGSWYTEGLDNKVPNSGVSAVWSNQDLQDLPEGSGARFRVLFQEQLSGGLFPSFGPIQHLEYDRTGSSCTDGRSYTFTIDANGIPGGSC